MADPPRRQSSAHRQSSTGPTSSPRAATASASEQLGSPRSPRMASSWGASGDAEAGERGTATASRSNRASIGQAMRVQVPGAAPPAVRRSLVGGLPSPVTGAPPTPPPQHSSPRLAQSAGASPRLPLDPSSRRGEASPRPSMGTVVIPSPRSSSFRHSTAAVLPSPRVRQPEEQDAGTELWQSTPSRTPKSSDGSLRRKPPPPLDFTYEQVSPKTRAQGDSSASSEEERILPHPPVNSSPSKAAQQDEERDTLSGLINFDPTSSPVLNTDIPSSRLSLSDDVPVRTPNDDTMSSYTSYLSGSTSGSSGFETHSYQPTTFASSGAYGQGVGLGLPFSMSAAANLSSLGASSASSYSGFNFPPPPIPSTSPTSSPVNSYRSPGGQSSGSPVADRGQLIGLGELATPRWTSGPLEKRWGVPESEERPQPVSGRRLEDKWDVVGSYGLEHEPPTTKRTGKNVFESPTISRPTPRHATAGRPITTYDSPNRPFAGSASNLYPASLMPSSASSATISTDASPAALLNFGSSETTSHPFGPLDFSGPSAVSPAYSFDAVGADSPRQRGVASFGQQDPLGSSRATMDEGSSSVGEIDVPRRRESRRKSFGTAVSAPDSAGPGQTWTSRADVIGLGFEHEIDPPLPVSTGEAAAKRQSVGSSTSASTKRSSTRSMSIDGKTSAKQHRRTSTGKSTFSHLPPSPAASTASHVFTASGSPPPALPPISTFAQSTPTLASSTASAPPLPTSSVSTPSGRTPDHSRLSRHSFHSHHSSPSIVAASILRHTRDLEGADVDIQHAASVDEGTAAALAKLDGLSSPRMSRIASSSTSATTPVGEPRSRKTSRGPGDVPAARSRDSSQSAKRRVRNSTGESAPALAKEIEKAFPAESANNSRSTSRNVSPLPPPPTLPSPSIANFPATLPSPSIANFPASPAIAMPKSPLSPSTAQTSPSTSHRLTSQNRLTSSTSTAEVPFPSTSPYNKRGSSSSTSMTAGTWTSASHDSTSATSLATRSTASKYRRSSAGSDISSTHSTGDGRPPLDRVDSTGEGDRLTDIPPVPPLPKDWETYRPTMSTASIASVQQSPRPGLEGRRPSETSSFAESTALPSPLAPPMQPTRTTSSSGRSGFESNLPIATTSTGGTGRRKWSISSAFHKATKSPKANSSVKESASFTDLQSAAGRRERTSSFGQHLSDAGLPRRLAASTSDIASLASGKSAVESAAANTMGSLGRSSIRSGKIPSFARTRTSSQSSSSTTRTAQTQATQASSAPAVSCMPPPSVVATSPGRSRSSLINPRRTPSGIPFFSRKSSTASEASMTTPSPNTDKGDFPSSAEERGSGRKSILGLNFLRPGGSRRDKEKGQLSPPTSSSRRSSAFSSATSSAATASHGQASLGTTTDEFGRRASLATPKSSSMLTRKRGKTIGSSDKGDVFGGPAPQPVQLPPMQINALPPSTARRVESMSSSSFAKPTTSSLLQTPRTRTSKLQDSLKANLPTIAGSPSTHAHGGQAAEPRIFYANPSSSTTPSPVSHTPTKIPRLKGTSSATASPRTSPVIPPGSTKLGSRRGSSRGSNLDTASTMSGSVSSPNLDDTSEFGVVSREPGLSIGEKTLSTRRRVDSETVGASQIPRSRSTASGVSSLSSSMRTVKEPVEPSPATRVAVPRAGRRPSTVDAEKRAPSATSSRVQPRSTALSSSASRLPSQPDAFSSSSTVTGLSASTRKPLTVRSGETGVRRASVPASVASDSLSSARSKSLASSKAGLSSRVPKPAGTGARLSPSTTESGRSSSASGTFANDDKVKGDEEMGEYVKRQYARQLAKGASGDTVRKMFEFPEPTEPLPPLSPEDALALYSRYLAPYEKEEIKDYNKVYFVGPNCDKKPATKENPTNNFGYDDERGDYLLVMHDHIQFRYEVTDVLGKGSFGQVLQCRDHKTGEMVAVKIIRNKKRFHHQALVEIKVLENLVKWDPEEKHYVIRMVESFTFRGHLCIVTELLSINLYELVKANSFAGFSTTLIRRFATQILKSLILLYHHRVVHCDLKPENILLRHPAKSGIKVIDFGSSCFENEKVYTYIQSRFYRSPEVILGMNYHMGIDMWSLGCILAEMYTGYPIFPGENEQEQLACIMEVQGLPDRYLIDKSSRKRLFFDSTGAPRPVVNSKGRRRRPATKTLEQVLRCQDELFVDFIAKCLTWDPDRRMKPEKALRHPWIAGARSAIPAQIPARASRTSSGLSSSTSSRTMAASSTASHSSSPSISTPLRKVPTQASTSTAPLPRTRTVSHTGASRSGTANAAATRLGSKASLGLPPSSRYSVKS